MPDKETYKRGSFMTGGHCPGILLDATAKARPPRYGEPVPAPVPTLSEITRRMDKLREKFEQVAQALRARRR